jgi:hypothetical protein
MYALVLYMLKLALARHLMIGLTLVSYAQLNLTLRPSETLEKTMP